MTSSPVPATGWAPFEPESALIAHEAVAEAAVIGVPDAVRGEIVKAFVVLKPDKKTLAGAVRSLAQLCTVQSFGARLPP
ncbi:MAG: hypothetical protein Ct9H300mP16_19540 [Pseudomonadota bacterium]|nr:MAG: hypothetical protein Ct9H300mP16_19540 [Pseudomonadota bacterium]